MTSLLGGGLLGAIAGYGAFEVGSRMAGEDRGVALGVSVGLVVGLLGVATGILDPLVSTLVGGGVLYLLSGLVVGLSIGVVIGTLGALYLVATTDEEYEEEFDIDELTDADVVTAMLEEFRRFSPGGAEALIDERDAYIAHNLVNLRDQGYEVVAVVGAGHRNGIEGYLSDPSTLPPMSSLLGEESGRRFSPFKIVGYLVTFAFVAFFALLILGGASNTFLLTVFGTWFLFNGIFAFTLAKIAGARWLSAGVGGAIAWLTSINPLLAPGWFAGYVELRHTQVNVSDIATLNEIIADEERPLAQLVSDLFDVPLFKLMMIVALTNLGSMAASYLYPFVVLPVISERSDVDVVSLMIDGAQNGLDIVLGLFGTGLVWLT
jgi:pheromone shutdown protein TraB